MILCFDYEHSGLKLQLTRSGQSLKILQKTHKKTNVNYQQKKIAVAIATLIFLQVATITQNAEL